MRLTTVLRRTAGLFTGLAVLAAVAYLTLFLAGYRPVAVYSGSMEPEPPSAPSRSSSASPPRRSRSAT